MSYHLNQTYNIQKINILEDEKTNKVRILHELEEENRNLCKTQAAIELA